MNRRPLLTLPFALCLARGTRADSYPDRAVRLIVPFPPGGATDVTARLFATGMTAAFDRPVVVDNRPGAAGAVGIDQVAKSTADGYTLGVSGVGPTAILPQIDPKLPYSPSRDLTIVAGLSAVDFILVARPSLQVSNLAELIALARVNPGKVTYSSAGVAGPQQLMIEHLAMLSGIKLFHIPYSGDSPAIAAVVSGDVDIAMAGAASAFGLIRSGKLKPLAASSRRSAELPDLATVAEQSGFNDFSGYTWNVLVAPKGTPAPVVAQINRVVNEIAGQPTMRQKLEGLGLRPLPGDVAAITQVIDGEVARYRRIIEATGVRRE